MLSQEDPLRSIHLSQPFSIVTTAEVFQAFPSLTVTELRVSRHVFYLIFGIHKYKYISRSVLWLFLKIAAGSVGPTPSTIFFYLLMEW